MNPRKLSLVLILLFAAAVRFWGITWGLPHEFQSEEYKIIKYALRMGTGDLNPHFFEYPSLYLYFMLFLFGVYYSVGKVAGLFAGPEDFALAFVKDPTVFYLLGRVSEAVCGVLVVFVVYKIGRRLFSETAGLLAASVIAGLPHFVYLSHIIKGYMGMTLLLLLFFWFCLDILEKGDTRSYVLSGILLGLAVSTRYHAAFFGIVLPAAHFLRLRRERRLQFLNLWENHKRLLLSLALVPTFFFLTTPYSLLAYKEFSKDVGGNLAIFSSLTGEKHSYVRNYKTLEDRFLTLGDVPAPKILGVLCFFGFLSALIHWQGIYVLILAPMMAYLWVVAGYHHPAAGYLIQVFPLYIVLAAHGFSFIGSRKLKVFTFLFFLAAVAWNAYEGASLAYSFTVEDTRTAAKTWIEKNIPEESSFLIDQKVMAPPLLMSYEHLERLHKKAEELNNYKRQYLAYQLKAHPGRGRGYRIFTVKRSFREIASLEHQVEESQKVQDLVEVDGNISRLKKMGIQYVIVYEDTEADALRRSQPGLSDFYRNLPSQSVLVQRFDPKFRISHANRISIYKL